MLFDHDGVLADSFAVFSEAFLAACREEGLAALATSDDVRALFEDNVYVSLERAGASRHQVRDVLRLTSEVTFRETRAMPPFRGIPETLAALGATHRVVVVTSNTEAVVAHWLEVHGVRGVAQIAGPETAASKIEKIRMLAAAHPRQETVWFVGDTTGDMREARAAGAVPLGVAWGWHEPARLLEAGAAGIAATPAEIVAIVCGGRAPAGARP